MRLLDYLDKGASLGAAARCLTMQGNTLHYGAVQRLSYRIGRAVPGRQLVMACLTIVPA